MGSGDDRSHTCIPPNQHAPIVASAFAVGRQAGRQASAQQAARERHKQQRKLYVTPCFVHHAMRTFKERRFVHVTTKASRPAQTFK